jgi:signal transduction histidine kinase
MESREVINKNIDNYLSMLTRDLGELPDTMALDNLARRTGLEIASRNAHSSYATKDYLQVVMPSEYPPVENAKPGPPIFKGHPYTSLQVGATWYTFFVPRNASLNGPPSILFSVIIVASLIVFVTFFAIRYFLKPLIPLTDAVEAFSDGNFEHRVEVQGRDELWTLAKGFNFMATQIRKTLTAKEQLLIDVSHELNSPIARMKLAVEMLPDNSQRTRLISYVTEVQTIVSQLLEATRLSKDPDALDLRKTDLISLANFQIALFNSDNPLVTFNSASEHIEITLDENRISTVLRNVIDNAIKYSAHQANPVEVSISESPNEARVSVRDFGSGIPRDESKLVFDAFYRVDKSRSKKTGGYGLGLSICQKIVTAHGGKIEIDGSKDPSGTEVTITLPKH